MKITERTYPEIKEKVPGWLMREKMQQFETIIDGFKKQDIEPVIVETGVFYGASAIAQLLIVKFLGMECQFHAIDPYSADASSEGTMDEANKEWWAKQDYNKAYESFKESLAYFKVGNMVQVWKDKSENVADMLPDNINLWHCDSNHTPEVVTREFDLYIPKLAIGGYVVCDDFMWKDTHEAYVAACDKFGLEKLHEYEKDGQSFAVYQKTRQVNVSGEVELNKHSYFKPK